MRSVLSAAQAASSAEGVFFQRRPGGLLMHGGGALRAGKAPKKLRRRTASRHIP